MNALKSINAPPVVAPPLQLVIPPPPPEQNTSATSPFVVRDSAGLHPGTDAPSPVRRGRQLRRLSTALAGIVLATLAGFGKLPLDRLRLKIASPNTQLAESRPASPADRAGQVSDEKNQPDPPLQLVSWSRPERRASPAASSTDIAAVVDRAFATDGLPAVPPKIGQPQVSDAPQCVPSAGTKRPEASRPLRDEDAAVPTAAAGEQRTGKPDICRPSKNDLGTAIHWVAGVQEASDLAEQQEKLIFLIQVSGNFSREEFT